MPDLHHGLRASPTLSFLIPFTFLRHCPLTPINALHFQSCLSSCFLQDPTVLGNVDNGSRKQMIRWGAVPGSSLSLQKWKPHSEWYCVPWGLWLFHWPPSSTFALRQRGALESWRDCSLNTYREWDPNDTEKTMAAMWVPHLDLSSRKKVPLSCKECGPWGSLAAAPSACASSWKLEPYASPAAPSQWWSIRNASAHRKLTLIISRICSKSPPVDRLRLC